MRSSAHAAAPVAAPSLLPALCDPLSFLCPSRQALRFDPHHSPDAIKGQIALVNSIVDATPFFEALQRAAPASTVLRFKPSEDLVELPESIARRAVEAARRGQLAVIHLEDPTLSHTATIAKALLYERAQRVPLSNTLLFSTPAVAASAPNTTLQQLLAVPLLLEAGVDNKNPVATLHHADIQSVTDQVPAIFARRHPRAAAAGALDALAVQQLVGAFLQTTLNPTAERRAYLHFRFPQLFTAAVDASQHRSAERMADAVLRGASAASQHPNQPMLLYRLADPAPSNQLTAAAAGCRQCRHAHPHHTQLLVNELVPTCRQCLLTAARALGAPTPLAGSVLSERQPKIAFMFLTRNDHKKADVWQKFLEQGQGLYSIYCHPAEPAKVTQPWLKERVVSDLIPTYYGHVSLVRATMRLLREALQDPDNEKFVLVSETCVPLYGFPAVYEALTRDHRGWLYDQGINASEMDQRFQKLVIPPTSTFVPRDAFHKQTQWMVWNRLMARVSVEKDYTDMFEPVFAVDEVYFINVLAKEGVDLATQTHNRLITYDRFVVRKERDNFWVTRDVDNINQDIIAEARTAGKDVNASAEDNPWFNTTKDQHPLFLRKITADAPVDLETLLRN